MTFPTHPRVAVVGAGPGGLTAARILQRRGVPVVVYDVDRSLAARNQGGTLDLHADSGQIAIDDAGLTAEFAALARPEGQSKRRLDPSGTVLTEYIPKPGEDAAPEIDRGQLRELLAGSLRPGTIQWGRRLTGLSMINGGINGPINDRIDGGISGGSNGPTNGRIDGPINGRINRRIGGGALNGRWQLDFDNGERAVADVVIGADGAWSVVRRELTDARPEYSGVSFVELRFDHVDERHPEVAALVGDGHLWANGDGRNIILQRNSGQHVRGYLGLRIELDWLSRAGLGAHDGRGGALNANGVQRLDTDRVRRVLLSEFADFAPQLRKLIIDSDGELVNRPIFTLPAPLTWEHRRGLTLIGDAAHLMSPFGGHGVNLAMLDGAELARGIADAAGDPAVDVDAAIAAYEPAMFARSGPIAVDANAAIREHYAPGGVDPDSIPDFGAEAEQLKMSAAAYYADRDAARP